MLDGLEEAGYSAFIGLTFNLTIVYYDNLPDPADAGKRINDMKIGLGVNLKNTIANTIFGIAWNTGSLTRQTQYHGD